MRAFRLVVGGTAAGLTVVASLGGGWAPAHAAAVPTVSIGDVSVVEGRSTNRAARMAITLSEPATTVVTVEYSVTGGTATLGDDFRSGARTVRFVPGRSGFTPVTRFVPIVVRPDAVAEDDETVLVAIGNPTGGYVLGRSTATATIIDDDPLATNEVSIGDASVVEGDSGMRLLRFPVTLSDRSYYESVAVTWTIDAVSANCAPVVKRLPTVVDQDCGVLTNLVRPGNLFRALFPLGPAPPRTGIPGPTAVSKFIDFAVFPDTVTEGDEQFTVTIQSSNFPIGRAVATGTIVDDD